MSKNNVKRVKKVITVDDAKRANKRFLIIVSCVLAAIIVTGLILGFINRPGLYFLADYNSVIVETHDDLKTVFKTDTDTSDTHDKYYVNDIFNKGLKKTRYSVLRMLLEGSFTRNFKFETEKEDYTDEDGKAKTRDVRVELKGSAITAHSHSDDSEFALTFNFGRAADGSLTKSVKVEGEELFFDTAKITVTTDGNNVIEAFKIRFYDSEMLFGDTVEVYEYAVTPVIVKAKTQSFMLTLQDVLDYFKQ